MHQSLYCLAASIVPVFIAAMSDYQSQAPKDKCCRCYDWLQQILIFKYRWYYPPRNGFPHSSSFKKSPAHLYLTRQLSHPSSPNAQCFAARPLHGAGLVPGEASPRAAGAAGLHVPTAMALLHRGKTLPSPTTRSVCPRSPRLLHGTAEKGSRAAAPLQTWGVRGEE